MGCPWNNLPRHRNPDTPLLLENDPNALEKLRLQAEQLNAERETAKQTAVQQRLTEAPRQMEIKDDTNADNIR